MYFDVSGTEDNGHKTTTNTAVTSYVDKSLVRNGCQPEDRGIISRGGDSVVFSVSLLGLKFSTGHDLKLGSALVRT